MNFILMQVEEVDNRYSMRMQGLMSDNTDLRLIPATSKSIVTVFHDLRGLFYYW